MPPFTLQVTPLEAGRSSETVMFTDETSRRQKPEDDNLNTHRPETPPPPSYIRSFNDHLFTHLWPLLIGTVW